LKETSGICSASWVRTELPWGHNQLISVPFGFNVEIVPAEFWTKAMVLHCHTDLKGTCWHVRLLDFCEFCLPADTFLVLSDYARRITDLFGSTYRPTCEQYLSKSINRINNERLERCLRITVISQILNNEQFLGVV
jgi:hypothetical protein